MLSSPPSRAAAVAKMSTGNIDDRPSCPGGTRGTSSGPASAPTAADIPHDRVSTRPTRTPHSAAESGFVATARICRPMLVLLKKSVSPATTAAMMATIRIVS
ncbi:hypothetical protein FQZ97_1211960 [compost metagenome]